MFHWPPFCPYQGTLERGGGRTEHINCLELKAVILALQAPPQSLGNHSSRHTLLKMDNTTIVAYVSRRGALSHHLWNLTFVRIEWMLWTDVFTSLLDLYPDEISRCVWTISCISMSRLPDLSASAVNAFPQDWSQWKSFIHLPVVLLPRILQKVINDKALAPQVIPDWPG